MGRGRLDHDLSTLNLGLDRHLCYLKSRWHDSKIYASEDRVQREGTNVFAILDKFSRV